MTTAIKYKTYSTFKPSGIDWLGNIPEEWESWKVAHLFNKIGSGTTPPSDNMDYYEGDIPWVITGELKDNEIFDSENKVTKRAIQELSALKIFPKNSLLIAMYGATIGKMAILRIPATTNQACCILGDSKLIDTDFAFYYFLSFRPHLIALSYGGGQPNISQDTIKSIKIFLPALTEQKEIVNFLDRETAKIDEVVEKKQKLIELLLEKRQGIISQAVTKGLNPKVKMKDSGILWLAKIPENWETKPLKRVVQNKVIKGIDKELPFLALEHVISGEGVLIPEYEQEIVKADEYAVFDTGQILFGKLRPYLRKFYRPNFEGCCPTEFLVLSPQKNVNDDYIFYLVQSSYFISLTNATSYGVKMPRTSWEALSTYYIPLPPENERVAIANYLNRITLNVNLLINTIKAQNQKLQEFRQALISNVVTGKVKVN
ncbi:MAG: restriction endonuclease subunit S [Patescibacteria group bacterium]